MRKTAFVTLILISLMTLGVGYIQPIKAQYQGNITINADGSVSPLTTPIVQTGDIYTLAGDVDGDIAVNASNIVLDGKGYTLLGGVSLAYVSNVTVKGFVITNTAKALQAPMIGIELNNTYNVIVANNTILGIWSVLAWNWGPYTGIYVVGGNSNTITQNNLMYNLYGMEFLSSAYNLIVQNNITNNPTSSPFTTGIRFAGRASNNTVYYNNFVNSTYLVKVSDSINTWDDGYLGNYWSDYKTKHPNAIQIDDSGAYNIPYAVDAQNIDRHPLTQPFSSEFYAPRIPLKISVLSPVNQTFNESSVPLSFAVNKQTGWMGYSLDGQDNVTVTGNSTINELTNGLHNVTVYARDEFDNAGASETINFNVEVPGPFPAAPVAAASIATVVLVTAGLVVYFKKRARRVQWEKNRLSPTQTSI
jgi:parallel beta-helix repeat protein